MKRKTKGGEGDVKGKLFTKENRTGKAFGTTARTFVVGHVNRSKETWSIANRGF